MIKFSVVIPTYNSSKYIVATINSVMNQSYLPEEIIIVDDFSDDRDELFQIISNIESTVELIFIQNYKNMNGSFSRNTGIMNANGNFIAFLDSDDLWLENKLEEVKNFISGSEKNPKIIFHQAKLNKPDTKKISIRPLKYLGNKIPNFLFVNRGFIQTSCIIVSKTVDVLFDERLPRHQDFQYCIDLSAIYDFYFIPMPLTSYTTHDKRALKSKESVKYSNWWIESNVDKIDSDSYFAFKTINLTSKYLLNSQYAMASVNFLLNFIKLSFVAKMVVLHALLQK